jgi:hypothetical protein
MVFSGTGTEDDEVIAGYVTQVQNEIARLIQVARARREGEK